MAARVRDLARFAASACGPRSYWGGIAVSGAAPTWMAICLRSTSWPSRTRIAAPPYQPGGYCSWVAPGVDVDVLALHPDRLIVADLEMTDDGFRALVVAVEHDQRRASVRVGHAEASPRQKLQPSLLVQPLVGMQHDECGDLDLVDRVVLDLDAKRAGQTDLGVLDGQAVDMAAVGAAVAVDVAARRLLDHAVHAGDPPILRVQQHLVANIRLAADLHWQGAADDEVVARAPVPDREIYLLLHARWPRFTSRWRPVQVRRHPDSTILEPIITEPMASRQGDRMLRPDAGAPSRQARTTPSTE